MYDCLNEKYPVYYFCWKYFIEMKEMVQDLVDCQGFRKGETLGASSHVVFTCFQPGRMFTVSVSDATC